MFGEGQREMSMNDNGAGRNEPSSIFKWETLREVEQYSFRLKSGDMPGKTLDVELTSGPIIRVWRADNCQEYFCHGLTFGGKKAPGGVVSPSGNHVATILSCHYDLIPEAHAQAGDILVWRGGGPNEVVHSAILTDPVVAEGTSCLDYSSRLQSKNGFLPEANMTLEELIEGEHGYGESYNTYRRK
jgi:hypothetical protein